MGLLRQHDIQMSFHRLVLFSLFYGLWNLGLFGQNAWFMDFGKSMDEVHSILEEKNYMAQIQSDPKLQRILVVIKNDKQIEYAFKNDKLFAISLSKYYSDKQKTKERLESTLAYLNLISNENVGKSVEGRKEVHTVITNSRVMRLFVIPEGNGKVLQLASFSRLYGELNQDSQFFKELIMLGKKTTQ